MADSDKGSSGGGAFNPKDLAFKPPRPAGEGGFSEPPKTWPHLVGVDGEEAKAQISKDLPGLNVILVPKGSMCTRDYRLDRVRVFVDESNKVTTPAPAQG